MTLDTVSGGRETGFTYYCCWPCVCDTEDFIKVNQHCCIASKGISL